MNVIPNSDSYRISSMRDVHFASAENKNASADHVSNKDQVTISQEGRDRLEVLADKTVAQLNAMTKEDFMDMLRQWKSENQPKLEDTARDYYDPDIPAKERQWTHSQLWAMLTDTHVALNDPYALAASGGTKTVDEMDGIARQAVKDKLDALIKERETQESSR